ncbi:MAG: right-handed parallel beta-helix repeat-containing protein, partial [SAR202 cluster bacterium]|nr:right-handed parallel beta-helix repeat-containing protein [SAR202 cluster bacterium]
EPTSTPPPEPTSTPLPSTPAAPTSTPAPTPTSTPIPCIPSGDGSAIQAALNGPGAEAILCPSARFMLTSTIVFNDVNQKLYTQGFPTDDTRAFIKVAHESVVEGINAGNQSGAELRNVIIDGSRPEYGTGLGGLIEWGGSATGQIVEYVKAYEPRGWSVLVVGEGPEPRCSDATIRYNELGPGGRAEYIFADGISLACRNSLVEHNVITDVTDGGIVIFQAPGSLIANNTIRSENRIMFYGISMVDYGPYDGDFRGTRVIGNTLEANGALMRHGIDMGVGVVCSPDAEIVEINYGAVVNDNVLKGDYMGYGFPIRGAKDWTAMGNIDLSNHLTPEVGNEMCFDSPVAPPDGFQLDAEQVAGEFQSEYQSVTFGTAGSMWPIQPIVSEECMGNLIGQDVLTAIRTQSSVPIWEALEATPQGPLLGRCVSVYEPPAFDTSADVMVVVEDCVPLCSNITLWNISEFATADTSNAKFIIQDFDVTCPGLPDSLAPDQKASCVINDYIAPGFQTLNWHGIPGNPASNWGITYPPEG